MILAHAHSQRLQAIRLPRSVSSDFNTGQYGCSDAHVLHGAVYTVSFKSFGDLL